jgi:hypothetical protein
MSNIATITSLVPICGVPDGKSSSDPAVRQAWLDQRAGGFTATEARDWGNGSRRREIIAAKISGITEDLSHIPAVAHGNRREPVLEEWILGKYGIEPCPNVYAHPENPRYLASPDGISRDPFTGELIVGTPNARLAEIKTSKHDLTPGRIRDGILMEIEAGSYFERSNYYTQMQWQMFVMNATSCLFVWEQHDNKIDPETGTFSPLGPPQSVWIMRDQKLIDILANEVAPKALAEIDAARAALTADGLPPASDLPAEHAILVADLLRARDAESIAKAQKERAWAKLQEAYLGDDKNDVKIDAGMAWLTVSTSSTTKQVFDAEAARKRAPKLMAQYEALVKRHTKPVPTTKQALTVTAKKEQA